MFECLSMLCVMIAAKQPSKFSIDAQNQQKSTKNHQINTNYQQQIEQDIIDQSSSKQETGEQQQAIAEKQHETRSEKRTTTMAVSNMQKPNIITEPPAVAAAVPFAGAGIKKPANSLNGASLTTTSAKIQQKQQKFLAAAAKSATSPPSAMIKTPSTTSTTTIGTQTDNKRLPIHHPNKSQSVVVDDDATGHQAFIMTDNVTVNCCQPVVVFDAGSALPAGDACQLSHAGRSPALLSTASSPSSHFTALTTSSSVPVSRQQQLKSTSPIVRTSIGLAAETQIESSKSRKNENLESADDSKIARGGQTNEVAGDFSTDCSADNRRQLREVAVGAEGEGDKRIAEEERVDLDDKENSSFVVSFASDPTGHEASPSSTSPNSLQNYHQHQDNNFLSFKNHFINNNHNNKHQNTTPDIHNHHNHHHNHNHHQNYHNHYQNNHHNNITNSTINTPPSHPNHRYHHTQSINYNCTNNIIKMPTQKFQHNQETFMKPKDQKISLVNKDNITCSTPHSSIGAKNNIINNAHQDSNITMNTSATQQHSIQRQQYNNFNNTNNHHHTINHHHQQQQQQQQTMAHYKFHNDCQSSVLTYEQVKRLDFVMDQTVPIHGRGNFPTLYVKLKELIRLVKHKLQKEHSIIIRDVRLNGGAASYVLAPENSHYNDLDLIFGTDLSNEDQFDVIRDVVLECLEEFFPKEHEDIHFNHMIAGDVNFNGTAGSNVVNSSLTGAGDKLTNEKGPSQAQTNQPISCDPDNLNSADGDDKGLAGESDGLASLADEVKEGVEIADRTGSEDHSNLRGDRQLTNTGCGNVYQPAYRRPEDHPACAVQQDFQYHQMPLSTGAIKEAYVHKMVKVNDDDRWSLISLGVQQSEVNCCGLNSCPLLDFQRNNQQQVDCTGCARQQPQFANSDSEQHRANAQLVSKENSMRNRQFPNSIELKFVDRMRRKFEFSVDSFQIILDSLIQFYDCAPQSTISSQRSLINSHLASTMINTRTSVNKKRCVGCSCSSSVVPNCKAGDNNDSGGILPSKADLQRERHNHTQNNQPMGAFTGTKSCAASLLNSSRSYYQLPIEPANSPSISSAASSSGCSSSSSVVSSSSSSLSCDDDHEDLYCDTDSPSSSNTSTSSLLSSTTLSLLSSDGLCNGDRSQNRTEARAENNASQQTQRSPCNNNKDGHHNAISSESSGDVNGATNVMASNNKDTSGYCCIGCCCQRNLVNDIHECERNNRASCAVISENFYPTVIGRSEYGNFKEALYHLEKKLIATRSPEEIRGGGMLKYCNLLVKSYKPVNVYQIRTLERYMCSRFFIDFSDLNQQQAKLESYLANHFSDDPMLKFDYLTILHNVVQRSTVCLMNHELRLTLDMIRNLAYKLNEQRQQQHHHQLHQQQPQVTSQNPSMAVQQLQHQQVQQKNLTQAQQPHQQQQQQHPQYYKQKPVLIQSGVYRVKLVNYTLAKPTRT